VRLVILGIAAATLFAFASGPVAAQQSDPNPTPTPTPTPTPEANPSVNGWPDIHKTLGKRTFTVGKVRATATITLVNGRLILKVPFKGRHLPAAVRKLSVKGTLVWRTIHESSTTGFKLHPAKRFSGRDKRDVGKKQVKWTYTKSWSIPVPTVTEVWQLRISARFNGAKITGSDPLRMPFIVLVPAAAAEPS
jgi:hypothetical protein